MDRLRNRGRALDPGATAWTALGGFATAGAEEAFLLARPVFATTEALTAQGGQAACVRNAADHLRPGGRLVIEAGVPSPHRLSEGRDSVPLHTGPATAALDVHDTAVQAVSSACIRGADGRGRGPPPQRIPAAVPPTRPRRSHQLRRAGLPGHGPRPPHGVLPHSYSVPPLRVR